MHLIVDAMNVIGVRPDGWWRDRPAARRALVGSLARMVDRDDQITVVFDGRPTAGEVPEASLVGLEALFAPGGPNAADAVIVDLVSRTAEGGTEEVVVVTSDAKLAEDVRRLGARVEGAGAFRKRLEQLGAGPGLPGATRSAATLGERPKEKTREQGEGL